MQKNLWHTIPSDSDVLIPWRALLEFTSCKEWGADMENWYTYMTDAVTS